MSDEFLQLLILLVAATMISATGEDSGLPEASDKPQEVLTALSANLSENLGKLKEKWDIAADKVADLTADLKSNGEGDDERTIIWPTGPPTIIIQPTPKPVTLDPILVDPNPKPTTESTPPLVTPSTSKPTPPKPVAVPPPAATIPSGLQPICGRRGSCYVWAKDEFELFQGGYTKCDALHEHRARRYCCVDANLQ